jgi:hypothetical protein
VFQPDPQLELQSPAFQVLNQLAEFQLEAPQLESQADDADQELLQVLVELFQLLSQLLDDHDDEAEELEPVLHELELSHAELELQLPLALAEELGLENTALR